MGALLWFNGTAGTLSVGAAPNRLPVTTSLGIPGGATFQLDANAQTVASLAGQTVATAI